MRFSPSPARDQGNTAPLSNPQHKARSCCLCGKSCFQLIHHWASDHIRNSATIPLGIWACECGLAVLDPVPSAEDLPETGEWWSPRRKEVRRNLQFKKIRSRIQDRIFGTAHSRLIRQTRRVVPRGQLLDIGCGTGTLLKEARAFYECTGLEPSDRAAKKARAAGFRVIHTTVEQAEIPDDSFDVVTMDAVLEHVRNPIEVLQRTNRMLRPGGIVVVKVPKLWGPSHHVHGREWNGFRIGYHLTMFTGSTLAAAFQTAGFTPLSRPRRDRWLDDILLLWGSKTEDSVYLPIAAA